MKRYVRIEWNIPNLLSLFRILLVPPFVFLFIGSAEHPHWMYWAFGVLALSALSDSLDGLIARRFNMITDFGKLLDPIADKLTQLSVILCMAFRYKHLFILMVLCVIKEVCQVIGSWILLHRGSAVRGAKWYGKVSTVCFYFSMILIVLFPDMPAVCFWALVSVVFITMTFSFVNYIREYIHLHRQLPEKKDPTDQPKP
ncbi:MAG: CDP-alcohol phosphatidyltransferase family protein [Clostridia bacterium]|nr:CDP-alcohol phosphatidyltransferase family protein [Clostridia bacterium]